MTFNEIEEKALNLLQKAFSLSNIDVSKPPIPVEKIAENFLGFQIIQTAPSNNKVSGMIQLSQKSIAINPKELITRQRFSIAHEIGHWVLHAKDHNGQKIFRTLKSQEYIESEVNMFAGALLMPAKLIYKSLFKNLPLITNFETRWSLRLVDLLPCSEYNSLNKLFFNLFFQTDSTPLEKKKEGAHVLTFLVPKMAEEFQVSREALSVRLRLLGLMDPIFDSND